MNLIEAVRSGKPFRRKGWRRGHITQDYLSSCVFTQEAVLADDWEVKEKPLKMKTVYEWLVTDSTGEWYLYEYLYTEDEITRRRPQGDYRKTGRSFEVPDV